MQQKTLPRPRTRLYVPAPLEQGNHFPLPEPQSHYLLRTLRAQTGECIAVFNNGDGEWLAEISDVEGKQAMITLVQQTKPFEHCPDIWLCFAPIKNEKIDFLVKRAVELGVTAIKPVITERTIARRVNMDRLAANAIEAAEQCGRVDLAELHEPVALPALLQDWPEERTLIHCDETGQGIEASQLLPQLAPPIAVVIGPEGGFTENERALLKDQVYTRGMSIGPRILRAETAALAALTVVQAWCGDWHSPPAFQEAAIA